MWKTIQFYNTVMRIFRVEFQQESLQALHLKISKQGAAFEIQHPRYKKSVWIDPHNSKNIQTTVRKYD